MGIYKTKNMISCEESANREKLKKRLKSSTERSQELGERKIRLATEARVRTHSKITTVRPDVETTNNDNRVHPIKLKYSCIIYIFACYNSGTSVASREKNRAIL